MNHIAPILLLLLAAASTGCNTVTIDRPIGKPLTAEEAAPFVGRWMTDESDVFDLRITRDNKLRMGGVQWDEKKEQYVVESCDIDARRVGNVVYFFLPIGEQHVGFVRIQRTGNDEMKVYYPHPPAFRAAVEKVELDGKVEPNGKKNFNVIVRADSAVTQQFFSVEELGDRFDKELTKTLHCIKRFEPVVTLEP